MTYFITYQRDGKKIMIDFVSTMPILRRDIVNVPISKSKTRFEKIRITSFPSHMINPYRSNRPIGHILLQGKLIT